MQSYPFLEKAPFCHPPLFLSSNAFLSFLKNLLYPFSQVWLKSYMPGITAGSVQGLLLTLCTETTPEGAWPGGLYGVLSTELGLGLRKASALTPELSLGTINNIYFVSRKNPQTSRRCFFHLKISFPASGALASACCGKPIPHLYNRVGREGT